MNRFGVVIVLLAAFGLLLPSLAAQDPVKGEIKNEQKKDPDVKKGGFWDLFMPSDQATQNIPPDDLFVRLLLAFVLGCVIAAIYVFTQRRDALPSSGFGTTLVLLCILIAMVTQVIGDVAARAFSLMGILSIVRFRTVVEDTRDTAFVIFAVVVGMGAGFDNRQVIFIGLGVVGVAAVALRFVPDLFARPDHGWMLLLRVSTGAGGATPWEAVLAKHCLRIQLQSTATARQGASLDLSYKIVLKKDVTPMQFLNEVNRIEGIQNLELKRDG